tara:strand:- start:4446 stop:4637 length:192 start_codon:yes stop_codon:yes gene_type:complete
LESYSGIFSKRLTEYILFILLIGEIKKNLIDGPKHVDLKGMDEWTRVRYPPPPPKLFMFLNDI